MSTITPELLAWLGDAARDATDDQLAAIAQASAAIDARYPDPDDSDDRDAALSGAVQSILGDATLEGIADEYRSSARVAETARVRMVGALIAEHQAGGLETHLAVRARVARDTVRNAIRA